MLRFSRKTFSLQPFPVFVESRLRFLVIGRGSFWWLLEKFVRRFDRRRWRLLSHRSSSCHEPSSDIGGSSRLRFYCRLSSDQAHALELVWTVDPVGCAVICSRHHVAHTIYRITSHLRARRRICRSCRDCSRRRWRGPKQTRATCHCFRASSYNPGGCRKTRPLVWGPKVKH